MNERGEIVKEGKFRNERAEFEYFPHEVKEQDSCRAGKTLDQSPQSIHQAREEPASGTRDHGIDHCLPILEALDERIVELSKLVKQKASMNEDTKLLMTIPGVGYFSALAILAEIGDIHRFPNEKRLCSYAGLVPSVDQSGDTRRLGRITREGSGLLRWVLVECVWTHLLNAEDTRLTRFFWRVANRRGKQTAAVATARKLLVATYYMLTRQETFRA